ncbi:MAG: glycosyltransferase [Myxococcota bacterium]
MKVVIASFLFAGHVFEHLALAQVLLDAGLSVIFYADAWARARAEAVGCEFVEAPTDGAADAFYRATSTEDVTAVYAALDHRLAPDLLGVLRRDDVGAVITDSTSLGAALAAERSGRAWASLSTTPAEHTPAVRGAGAQFLASSVPLRGQLGLPPSAVTTAEQILSPWLVLCTWSASFDAALVPAQARHIGPLFLRPPGTTEPPAELDALDPARPTVLLSTSSVAVEALEGCGAYIREVAISVLADLEVQALISVPGNAVAELDVPASEDLIVLPFVPHALLLPKVDLMISHGGWGTVGRALAHGIPSVLTPLALDQPQVAELCEACGVGIALDYDDLDEDSLQDALERVLAPESPYPHRAEALRVELRETMARGDAAGLIRDLMAEGGA